MAVKRTDRLNSLLKEVLSDVIKRDVRNPHVNELMTVTRVEITKDLHYAKVYVSIIGSPTEKQETIGALNSAKGFIAVQASKKVVLRYFPNLTFILDDSVDKQIRIESLLTKISEERKNRHTTETDDAEPQNTP
ncbi:MAG: 30S ribosome-binding factor RbfA [Parachlamydiaceae bacterium]